MARPHRGGASPNTVQRRRGASQTKPLQECHPERSAGSVSGERSCAALRMTKPDGLFFELYCPLRGARPIARARIIHRPCPPLGSLATAKGQACIVVTK